MMDELQIRVQLYRRFLEKCNNVIDRCVLHFDEKYQTSKMLNLREIGKKLN